VPVLGCITQTSVSLSLGWPSWLGSPAGRRPADPECTIYDIVFAVASVLDWYCTNADVPAMMPRLATYLGHTDPKHTYWYLTAAPELMALAGQRLDAYLVGRS
jgi:integrase/recombinase XerD